MNIIIRKPELTDGQLIYDLAKISKPLDLNSLYSYLLISTHFNQTSAVAEKEQDIIGYVSGYLHPHKHDTLFIWQIAVNPNMRGKGLATLMLQNILQREELIKIKFIEATITPSNKKSRKLFQRLAEQLKADYKETPFLDKELFGESNHEEEKLLRIGPITL
jgi:L-2,4-diaminobutyric acid acetyltransferase